MATTAEIGRWFDEGVAAGSAYMLVICDTFTHEDYPFYVGSVEAAFAKVRRLERDGEQQMLRLMEVYDLAGDRDAQLAEDRAFHLPLPSGSPEAVEGTPGPEERR